MAKYEEKDLLILILPKVWGFFLCGLAFGVGFVMAMLLQISLITAVVKALS